MSGTPKVSKTVEDNVFFPDLPYIFKTILGLTQSIKSCKV